MFVPIPALLLITALSFGLCWVVFHMQEDRLFEHRRRVVVTMTHAVSTVLNAYVIVFDSDSHEDLIKGFSNVAHVAFAWGLATYAFDTGAFLFHPRKSLRTRIVWIVHHIISVMFLFVQVFLVQKGAFPSACFMISSATHITANLRWFEQSRTGLKSTRTDKIWSLANTLNFFVTAVAPIPYMFHRIASQRGLASWWDVPIQRKCIAGTLLIYVPHVLLFVRLAWLDVRYMNRPAYTPKRVKFKKKE